MAAAIQIILFFIALWSMAILIGILQSLPFAFFAGFASCALFVLWLRKQGWPN
jgi:hypothetical protein